MSLFKKIEALFGSKEEQAPVEPIIKKKVSAKGASTKTSVSKKTSSGPEVITKKEAIPNYERIISYDDEEIALSEDLRRNYIVLMLNSSKNEVAVICSLEQNSKTKIDNVFLTIKEKCILKGFKPKQYIASRNIISIIYQDDEKRQTGDRFNRDKKEGYISEFDRLITTALEQKVSDVHIEVRRKDAVVRFRKHGDLYPHEEWAIEYARDMSSVIYQVMADEKEPSFIETKQQAARIERKIAGHDLGIRLNTLPASGGFDVVMRILKLDDESEADRVIDTLGYSVQNINDIYRAMSRPTGVIIVAGTTGSGKSTTLSTMLNTIIRENSNDGKDPKIKVITVEDPTEYTIIGATQHGVVRNRNKPDEDPFAEAIKAAMRCDPDILMVGEVRDQHSAKLLVGAVQSGHTAFTTVHAASAIGIIPRLKGFGVDSETLGSSDFISALIYQTLLPTACPDCSISFDEFKKMAEKSEDQKGLGVIKRVINAAEGQDVSKVKFRNNDPEHKCTNPECVYGVVGRTVVAEVVNPNPMILSAFEMGSVNLAKYYHIKMGGKLIRDHAVEKVLNGVTDPRDAEDKVDLLDEKVNLVLLEKSLRLSKEEIDMINEENRKNGISVESSTGFKSDNLKDDLKSKKEEFHSRLLRSQDEIDSTYDNEAEIIRFSEDSDSNNSDSSDDSE